MKGYGRHKALCGAWRYGLLPDLLNHKKPAPQHFQQVSHGVLSVTFRVAQNASRDIFVQLNCIKSTGTCNYNRTKS